MARALSRAWGLLRSRRVAVALIVSLASYVFVGTLIPQPSLGEAEWAKWETANPTLARVVVGAGMRDPYATPVFFGLAFGLGHSGLLQRAVHVGVIGEALDDPRFAVLKQLLDAR